MSRQVLRSVLVYREHVRPHILLLEVKLQLETVSQDVLQHDVQNLDAGGLVSFGIEVVKLLVHPAGATDDLLGSYLIGDVKVRAQWNARANVSIAARRAHAGALCVRWCWFNRPNLENLRAP